MISNGLYIIKQEYIDLVKKLGSNFDDKDASKRPIYCCVEDKYIKGLYWAIPTSDWNHRSSIQQEKYLTFMNLSSDDLRSSYYYKGMTTKPAIYKISSCFPIIDKYIDHPYMSNGKHVIVKNKDTVNIIFKKLKHILAFEGRNHNYFPQHITTIKEYLIKELKEEQ